MDSLPAARPDPIRILRRAAVRDATGLSDDQIDALEHDGEFPRRVVIAPRSIGWVEHEVQRWLQARVAARDDAAAMAAAYEARLPPGARYLMRRKRGELPPIEADAPT
jgi:prophage regulatory protein